jgi:hypothetical protein
MHGSPLVGLAAIADAVQLGHVGDGQIFSRSFFALYQNVVLPARPQPARRLTELLRAIKF